MAEREEFIAGIIERIKRVKLQSYHQGYIGSIRLELNWLSLGFIPHPQCLITVVDNAQAKSIRESRMGANTFYAPLDREELVKLRSQIDDVLKIIEETEAQFGTTEEREILRALETEQIAQAWKQSQDVVNHIFQNKGE